MELKSAAQDGNLPLLINLSKEERSAEEFLLVNVSHLGLPYLPLRFMLVYFPGFFSVSFYQHDTETLQ